MSKAEARLLADQLLRGQGIKEPPVKLRKLAKSKGLQVNREKLEPHVSSILFRGKEPRITLNKRHDKPRQRFALAHALGHFLLHGGSSAAVFLTDLTVHFRYGDPVKSDPRELEANAFAMDLLLPEHLLRADLRGDAGIDLSDTDRIEAFAARYGVSPAVLVLRMARLGLVWGL